MEIALVGNSNSGKSHLFNRLTGFNRNTGNWDGVSVDIKRASVILKKEAAAGIWLSDLPGLPSLDLSYADDTDHELAKKYVIAGQFDLLLNILDASCLEKGLHLTLQLLERGIPMAVVINKADLIEGVIDHSRLEEHLGVPVLVVNTITKEGIEPLLQFLLSPSSHPSVPGVTLAVAETTHNKIENYQKRAQLIRSLVNSVIARPQKPYAQEMLDRIFTNRFLALPAFLLIMLLGIFVATFVNSGTDVILDSVQDYCTAGFAKISPLFQYGWVVAAIFSSLLSSVIVVLGLIPALLVIYGFLSLMEESGYLARVVIVVDGLLQKLQLDGKAFVPLILGFGCNVTAILSLKIIESKVDRLKLALALPFVNCNARLAIYTILTSYFFPKHQVLVIFSLYLVSIIVSFLVLWALRFIYRKGEREFLIFELPKLGVPSFKAIFKKAQLRVKGFMEGAAVMIISFSFIIMLLTNILFQDMGFAKQLGLALVKPLTTFGVAAESWQTPYLLLSGLIAKEAMIGTLNGFNNADMLYLADSWQGNYALLLFIMLYFPCVSVFSVTRQGFGAKVAMASVLLSLVVAYVAAFSFYHILV